MSIKLLPSLTWYKEINCPKIRAAAIKARTRVINDVEGKDKEFPSLAASIGLGFYGQLAAEGPLFWNAVYMDLAIGEQKPYDSYAGLTIDVVYDSIKANGQVFITSDVKSMRSFSESFKRFKSMDIVFESQEETPLMFKIRFK